MVRSSSHVLCINEYPLTDMDICKGNAALVLNPTNNSVLFTLNDPIDSSNASHVLQIARGRIWPIFVVEQILSGFELVGGTGNMACPQAFNLTSAGIQITNTSSSSTSKQTGTANIAAVGGNRESVVVCWLVMLVMFLFG